PARARPARRQRARGAMRRLRAAGPGDIPGLVRIINLAYRVAGFFVHGDRTDADEGPGKLGGFPWLAGGGAGTACAWAAGGDGRGYFGPLAIDPARQGGGRARALIDAVEDACRAASVRHLDLTVVSVRPELVPFYERLGFQPSGTAPFPDPEKLKMPCHFIIY